MVDGQAQQQQQSALCRRKTVEWLAWWRPCANRALEMSGRECVMMTTALGALFIHCGAGTGREMRDWHAENESGCTAEDSLGAFSNGAEQWMDRQFDRRSSRRRHKNKNKAAGTDRDCCWEIKCINNNIGDIQSSSTRLELLWLLLAPTHRNK